MTTTTIPSARVRPECVAFITRLRHRLATDTGLAAQLRRAAGAPLAKSRMLAEWYGFLDGVRAPAEFRDGPAAEVAFLVATLLAYDRKAYRGGTPEAALDAEEAQPGDGGEAISAEPIGESKAPVASDAARRGNFGATLGALVEAPRPEEDAMARRLAILLDSSLDEAGNGTLPWRLRRVAKLALSKQKRLDIDWPRLLHDLLDWNMPARRVQREWAQAFYRTVTAPAEAPTDESGQLADDI